MTPSPPREAPVAIIAPGGRDAAVVAGILETAGIPCRVTTVTELLGGVADASFAAAVIAEEALTGGYVMAAAAAVDAQPPWSDFPCIVLTRRNRGGPSNPVIQALRNVAEVERPVHPATLLATVRSALRARGRQHETAEHLRARAVAEAELVKLAQTLETKVEQRTEALRTVNRQLKREMLDRAEAQERLRAIQAELIHVSRVSAMNTMGSAIAHELNQPLAAILSYMRGIERLLAALPDAPDELKLAVGAAAGNAHRAGKVIRHLRNLVQRRGIERQPHAVAHLIEEARTLALMDSADQGVDCRIDVAPGLADAVVDAIQIQQVLINVLRNAVEAMEGCATRTITITAAPCPGDRIRIAIEDSGPGVSAELLSSSFPTLTSTKPTGLGIGLSICRTIIEDHGGTLAVCNGERGGALVTLDLPTTSA
jgi:C4-dicarboxylate-specific signal transduction histidine kinase